MNKVVLQLVKISARMLVLVILFALAVVVGRGSYQMGYRIYTEPAMSDSNSAKAVSVQITEDMSDREIARLMEESGLCKSEVLFFAQLQLSEYKNRIKPGLYTLSTDMRAEDIIAILGGKNPDEETEES